MLLKYNLILKYFSYYIQKDIICILGSEYKLYMNFVYKQNHILVDNVEIVPMSMTKT